MKLNRIWTAIVLVAGMALANGGSARAGWNEGSTICGLNRVIAAAVVLEDGGGPALYAGGSFAATGGVISAAIAEWQGSGDCNMNGLPDDEDIANCGGVPSCDDCNLNGVPDSCDIASATSQDVDMDGIPDECVSTNAVGADWTDDIWGLSGGYPDNDDSVPNLHVSLYDAEIFLDATVTIPSLRILEGSTLDVSQTGSEGDLNIEHPIQAGNPDALVIRGDTGGMPVSSLLIGDGRTITVTGGAVRVAEGGRYEAAPPIAAGDASFVAANNSQLNADSVIIGEGMTTPGTMLLSQGMTLVAGNNVTLDGLAAVSTSCTPPILSLSGSASMEIAGDFTIDGAGDTTNTSTNSTQLEGDWKNNSLEPEGFDWTAGKLTMGGGVVARNSNVGGEQLFEVAGNNLGPIMAGFDDNYALGSVEIAPLATVSFVDQFDNSETGQSPCSEALYVNTLTLGNNAIVSVNNTRIYCNNLVDNGADITLVGCGDIVELLPALPPVPAVSEWGIAVMVLLTLTAATVVHGRRWKPHT